MGAGRVPEHRRPGGGRAVRAEEVTVAAVSRAGVSRCEATRTRLVPGEKRFTNAILPNVPGVWGCPEKKREGSLCGAAESTAQ